MCEKQPRRRRRGRGRGQPPPPPQQQQQQSRPPFYLPNNVYYRQPPVSSQNLNPPIENLAAQNPFDIRNQISNSIIYNNKGMIDKIDEVVVKARRDLVVAGENVSSWKVSNALLGVFEPSSWLSLRGQMQHVPSLNSLKLIEEKINAYINCFVEVWKITTLYDLETEICKCEGVEKFEELELGPLIRHPLIIRYFCVSADSTGVFRISGQEILSFLVMFLETRKGKEVKVDELLDFVAENRSVDSKDKLHVRIQSLGLYIGRILQARSLENAKYKNCLLDVGNKIRKLPVSMSQKKPLEENLAAVSEHTWVFSDNDEDEIESDDNEDEACLTGQSKKSFQDMKSSDQINGSSSLDRLHCNEGINISVKKRKSDVIDCTTFVSHKIPKRDGAGQGYPGNNISNKSNHEHLADISLDINTMMAFIMRWKDNCKRKTVPKVIKLMLMYYKSVSPKIPIEVAHQLYKSYPLVGLINIAIRSIKCGMWDSMPDAFQTLEQQEESVTAFEGLFDVIIEAEQALAPSFQTYFVTNKPSFNVCLSNQLLDVLVAQASHSILENEILSIQNVEELLTKQFPLIPFKLDKEGSLKSLEDIVKANNSNLVSKSVIFSAALSSRRIADSSLEAHFSSKDAITVLRRAPMLSDLNTWSHWDVLFAPSLGPLTSWLLTETNAKELLCLVTRSGAVIRIDHTATVDSFLEASSQGSSFHTAVNLLSLFVLYGGERNVPSSLLKCHAEKAFKVIVKNSLNNGLYKDKSELNSGISAASVFILDCLAYLPVEFRCFATDLLLSGFRLIAKNAPSVILEECKSTEHRLMLHELGLSLNIMEWINDYNTYSFTESSKSSEFNQEKDISTSYFPDKDKGIVVQKEECKVVNAIGRRMVLKQNSFASSSEEESAKIIECIRREEFGLDPHISAKEDSIMKKQHARLGRALHCLSQELYSQDSHFLLELVQNADDNVYPCGVEPALTFILQEAGIIVLNNERGFSVENIKALCDVGNSTKKEPSAGYIGKKGIGFKSVFRVTNAPEIHSNGFHIKFDISDGQIGFVLPTVVPPCDIDLFSKLVSVDSNPVDEKHWNTCIVLPFKSKKNEAENLISMFSDLHPSLLLFLHRLECIKFRNLLNDSFIVMRKEVVGDNIVNVFHGNEKMTWFVKSHKLQADHIRHDVDSTEISMALMLEDLNDGNYIAKLDHQPVFAFLPVRNYGLKFIIQADFILPSSREEIDGDSPWNQWLLSEFPNLFVSAQLPFCNLPCFKENPAKAVTIFLSFVPLGGEVHGFFSCLPRMILSKLQTSNCLPLEGDGNGFEWVQPCKVLRNWTEETRSLLPDSLIKEHLGVGYLNKDTVLTDSLARALRIEECGPRILLQIMASLCSGASLKSLGLSWLSSWINALYLMLANGTQSDVISQLGPLSFIPLLDGNYASINDGAIWLHTDPDNSLESFEKLYPKLRIVNPGLLNDSFVENITQMLYKVGVQQLSAHEVIKVQILAAVSDEKVLTESKELMVEYLSFIMFHLETPCPKCLADKEHILSQLRNNAFISTNLGYKRLVDVPIHFSKEFGNPIDMSKLVGGTDMPWFEIDISYLEHRVYKSSPGGALKLRKFLKGLGVTDFVQIVKVEKRIEDISHSVIKNMMLDDDCLSTGSTIKDYDSKELMHLLSLVSSNGDREKARYLLKVLDTIWDDYFSDKITGICSINGQYRPFKSSVLRILHGVRWLASTIDDQLHFPNELFHNCETVHAFLGDTAPYAVPKINRVKFISDIGLKNTITLDDALSVLEVWRKSKKPFMASISQMSKFYTYIWNEMSMSKQKIVESLHSQAFIFVPYSVASTHEVVSGLFLSSNEVYWHDSTGSMEQTMSTSPQFYQHTTHRLFSKMLCNVYPGLYYFFVKEFRVAESPPLLSYVQSLLQLSTGVLPSQGAKTVFHVLQKWSDGLESGVLTSDDIDYLKTSLEETEMRILPTVQDKWVSLHQSFGLLCWCDDEQLSKEFKNLKDVDFLFFGELTTREKQMLQDKVSVLFRRLGILKIEECGPKFLVQIMKSVCSDGSLRSMGLNWLSSWLNVFYLISVCGTQADVISSLRQLPFIPLSDGTYASISDGAVWLHTDPGHGFKSFQKLYSKLRIVSPALFKDFPVNNIAQMLFKVGVHHLSAHEVLKGHILPAISDENVDNVELMTEYLSFVMFHLDTPCLECRVDKEHILSHLRNNAFVSTNHGYKRLVDVPIHFSKEFGNPIDMDKLVGGTDMKWFEIDIRYLKHPVCKSLPGGTLKLRKFLQELGVTDFVNIVKVENHIEDISQTVLKNMMLDDDCISSGSVVTDYDSHELMHLLSHVSSNGDREKANYLLEVLDRKWNDYFADKLTGFCCINGQYKPFKSSVLRILHGIQWLASSMDDQLHFPKDLFHSCDTVCAVLGDNAPYVVPKVNNVKLLKDVGLKNIITLDDALSVLKLWRRSEKPFRASISQMSKFYTFIWNEMSISKQKIVECLHSQAFIFVPYSFGSTHEAVYGSFSSATEVYWHDYTGLMELIKSTLPQFDRHSTPRPFSYTLSDVYPGLHYFFVNEFGVDENPPLLSYLQSLLQLSSGSLPSQAAKIVFQVFQKWSDGLDSGFLSSDDIDVLKKNMEENEMRILPTVQNKWVSLHQSFGIVCWCDDEQLRGEFKSLDNVHVICLGELTTQEKQILRDKVSVLFRRLEIPSLSEVVTREVIYDGVADASSKTKLVRWALPYAQRYIYSIHPNEFSKLKLSGFKNLSSLRIAVVEQLFYKNVIKRFEIESNKRYECSCLIQDNILYATRESDTYSLYMELSRFLVAQIHELPLANFLHMITIMAESGSTEEQIEFFVMNSQKLLKLPSEETKWSILSLSSPEEDKDIPTTKSCFSLDDLNPPKFVKMSRKIPPGSEYASESKVGNPGQMRQNATEGLSESNRDKFIEENLASKIPLVILEEDQAFKGQSDSGVDMDVGFNGQLDNGKNPIPYDIVVVGKDYSNEDKAAKIIESIRQEEFGLDPDISATEDSVLKKQHTRLGRALHCLSQELYSQDSHFLLELVQNADDNVYPCDVEPTLTFILQETGIIVLNNEEGFSVENIKALCDVGNSTKKESSGGYIGKKGIGFKSVFRVTDAPEIHSNGFHIKFDISEGQIGFVLPTVVPPCDLKSFSKLVSVDNDQTDEKHWNTCIVLPFRSKKIDTFPVENLMSMFLHLHPSLLLFLHRLECIKFRNLVNDSLIVMRKEVLGEGIVNVYLGEDKKTWFIKSCKLQADHIRHDVKSTEISMAVMLEDPSNGNYIPKLDHQPVFAFLPLRNYGLKFIIQADFVLPSSREEVDGDSPWNRWLLSEFPSLFVSAELSFCSLPCFKENPAKGISVFMSFVPLEGEVQGFFSCLPGLIISKLKASKCMLLEGNDNEWVLPCKVLRNWTEQTRSLLPDSFIKKHLGVGYLNKDTILTDPLARALLIEECGPKTLLRVMRSLCGAGSLKSMGLTWLSSWLNVLYLMLVHGTRSDVNDVISSLRRLQFIPLLDGTYASVNKSAIWLHTDENGLEAFGTLYSNLRIVNPALLNDSPIENIRHMLCKVGVQQLSAHEVLKVHILPHMSKKKVMAGSMELMTEYLSFIMFHLESSCLECLAEKEHILSELRKKAFICTNDGYKRIVDVPIHFCKEFKNPIDMRKLVSGIDMQWFEIDISYLKHPVCKLLPEATLKWRKFLQELGVTDFVRIVRSEMCGDNKSNTTITMLDDDFISSGSNVKEWDSQELINLLSRVSSNGDREKSKYLLEVLDTLWDDYFSDKPFKASVIRILNSVRWLASSMDDQFHFPKDLFHDCERVREVLGDSAPYAIRMVNSVKLLHDIGFKHTVTLDDALSALKVWRISEKPFKASISQMSNFYTHIWSAMSVSKPKFMENLHSQAFIFVPCSFGSMHEVVSGVFLSPSEVYWHDSTGSMEQTKTNQSQYDQHMTHHHFAKMLCNVYPGLHYFFVNELGVAENPPLLSYLQSLLQLSTLRLPSQAAKTVFRVFQKWIDGLESGVLSSDDIDYLKKSMEEKEMTILATVQDKWVSLHQSFGLVCWCDDEQLRVEFENLNNIDFLYWGELSTEEEQMIHGKVSVLFRRLGIPSLSEVVTREARFHGPTDSNYKTSLVNWSLPYAQRYIYSIHPIEYSGLKLSGFKNINSLRIVVVEQLFYKNVIKRLGVESNKRYECNCLIQDNILYATHESDSHPLFMELSRLLVPGIPELHLANFLHMITTMAKSGFTEEKMEFFITNSQKLPKLPIEESQWSLLSMSIPVDANDTPTTNSGFSLDDLNAPNFTVKKSGKIWPPVHWKPAPGFEYAQTRQNVTEELIEDGGEWIIQESHALTTPSVMLEEDETLIDELDSGIYRDSFDINVDFSAMTKYNALKASSSDSVQRDQLHRCPQQVITREMGELVAFKSEKLGERKVNEVKEYVSSSDLIHIDQLNCGTVTPQEVGRAGEFVAFKYFSAKLSEKTVRWVNEIKESGLPYDIVVEGKDDRKEYIEVKATSIARKDWFFISVKEWQLAIEKGESFSIAYVVLSAGKPAQITTYRDPVKLCQSRRLQLSIRSSK